ncbi:glycogen synthase kinase binding protein [Cyclopterus lumpus]|uniref:glycogen synthase kinase binding protein n=1 Tax=Cyclopterus lumpus TaxID=8103 RepID=UPI00148754E6|nr:glycogen synthase kinase binding protein [Cyclopterus lumpus]
MPCRKEDYIFLEQSVSVDSKEVDALVTKIGEALQLHNNNNNNSGGAHQKTVSVSVSCLHGLTGTGRPEAVIGGAGGGAGGGPVQKRHGCCMRLRTHRASPYCVPGSNGDRDWDQIRPWNRKRKDDEEDPHRMLQDLILSGNLIKEAVRRLQVPRAADGGPS